VFSITTVSSQILAFVSLLVIGTFTAVAGELEDKEQFLRLPLVSAGRNLTGASPSAREPARKTKTEAGRPPALQSEVNQATLMTRAKPGPWGDLEYSTVYLEASISVLKAMELQTYESEWNFVGIADAEIIRLINSVDLPALIRDQLLDSKKWRRHDKIVTLLPSTETLLSLPPAAREAIYRALAQWSDNPFHQEPERVAGGNVREWLQRAALPEEVLATIEKISYRRGNNLVFADVPLVLRMVKTEEERLKIRKALSRTPTLVAHLRLTPETNISALVDYWGSGSRTRDIAPFLESAATNPAINSIDLIHLLPMTARRHLYTYPSTSHGRSGYYPDCHWTSLNFRNFEPLDRLADPVYATAYVLENYTKVQAPYRYGDVLFFMDGKTGNAIHSCVFVADDIVFTKNGRSPTQPWVLMKLDDLVAYYSMFYTPQIACYRRNGE
jgi:hypothetical protein